MFERKMGSNVEETEEGKDTHFAPTNLEDQHQEEIFTGSSNCEKVNSCSSEKLTKTNNGGGETSDFNNSVFGGANNSSNSTRRIFTPAFKQSVLEAFMFDPDCIGNQRATARKFGIHRRQVQKWTQLEKEKEGEQFSSFSSDHNLIQEGSSGSTSSTSTLGTSPSSSEKLEEQVQEPVAKDLQVDLSPSSSSSNNSSTKHPPADLCNMSSTAMAMSLNLSLNSGGNNSLISSSIGGGSQKKFHKQFDRPRNNASPTPKPQTTSSSITSPTSILSKFYSLYNHSSNIPHIPPSSSNTSGTNYLKYQGLNLNGDLSKTNSISSNNGNASAPNSFKALPPPSPQPQRSNTRSQMNQVTTHAQYLQILDEIASKYPHDDYSLLRQALIRNEVSFTRVASSAPKSTFFPPHRSPENQNINGWGNSGRSDNSRTSSPNSASPKHSSNSSHQDNLALELLRQQSEYMRLVQQTGGFGFSDLSPEGNKANGNSLKYPWLHPLAQAAAANLGLQLMGTTNLNGQKKPSPPQHVFISPKPPNNSKPKTVAAALAASRTSPNSLPNHFATNFDSNGNGQVKKRSTAPRKRGKPNRTPKPSCTITRPNHQEEDFVDPTSMLEITTGSSNSETTNSNLDLPSNGNGYQMEHHTPVNGSHFLNSFFPSPENENQGYRVLESPECAEIKKYLEQMERKSPSDGGEPDAEQITKAMALEAFTYDHEVAGDCRAVARKFGLNVRVVMKWIKESANKISNHQTINNLYKNYAGLKPVNGNGNGDMHNSAYDLQPIRTNGDLHEEDDTQTTRHLPHNLIPFPTSSNKRKTSKPNQICDFQQDEDDDLGFGDVPLDMMIPIKKRRVSSQE